jgi:hypothetical protein
MKVHEDKEEGLVFNGPFYGPIALNETDAKRAARDLSNQTRSGAVISRIYAIKESETFSVAMDKAKPIFERIKTDMVEAKQIVDRPVIKRKKRR